MTSLIILSQLANEQQGWLTQKLLSVTLSSAEWVLWLLAALSVMSFAVIFERIIYFTSRRLANNDDLLACLARGDLDGVKAGIAKKPGMEAAVLREGLNWADKGADSVQEAIHSAMASERPRYERSLSFLGTLGSNAPFVGLFGTVLGIIKAFNDLGASAAKGTQIQQTVMAGISEALVATAVGLAVAIPAVVGYNMLTRALKNTTSRATALGHALVGHLRSARN
jgi:biopolymer transport protein ExbB